MLAKKHIILLLVLFITTWNITFYLNNVSAQEYSIPSWIKNNAKWWHDKEISDSEFVQGIQFLLNDEVIKIPQITVGPNLSEQIPTWIRTSAGAWADNLVSDEVFGKEVEHLIGQGIIKISSPQPPETLSELAGNVTILTSSSEHVFNLTNTGIIVSKTQTLNTFDSTYIVETKEGNIVLAVPSFTDEKIYLDSHKGKTGLKISRVGSKIVNYQIFSDKINTYAWNTIKHSIDFADKNSSSVINHAFDALPHGGVVRIDSGTYTLSGTILLHSDDVLEGSGWSTILKMTDGANNTDMIKEKKLGEENIVIRNLQIDGNRINQFIHPKHAIYLSEVANVVLDHVFANHIDGTAIAVFSAGKAQYNQALINSVVNDTARDAVYFAGNRAIIVNNTLTNWNDTGLVLSICRDCIASNNQISGIPTAIGNGIAIISNSTRVAIFDNEIKNSPHDGIVFQRVGFWFAGNNILISGNHILDNSQNGINMGTRSDKNYGVTIDNNEIINNAKNGVLIAGNKTRLTNNLIEKNGGSGVFLYNAYDTLIRGNIIADNGLKSESDNNYGIEISGDPPYGSVSTLITGNYIFDDQLATTQKLAINTEPASSDTTIKNNQFDPINIVP